MADHRGPHKITRPGVSITFYPLDPDAALIITYILAKRPGWPTGEQVGRWLFEAGAQRWDTLRRQPRPASVPTRAA
jgi:hypothetical protein